MMHIPSFVSTSVNVKKPIYIVFTALHVSVCTVYKASGNAGCIQQAVAVPCVEYPKKMTECGNRYLEDRETFSRN
jgi:hypothetical protein